MSRPIASEAELIERYLAPLARGWPGALGLRDDAAIVMVPEGCELVLTTDAVAAGVHFFPEDDAADIAWKALAVNVSDLAAKAAAPLVYQMALSFPQAPTDVWMQGFADGLAEAQAAFGIVLSGGDCDRRPGPVTVTITACGAVPKGRAVKRSTGQPGDKLFVSGALGDAALGLMLRRDPSKTGDWGIPGAAQEHLLKKYLRPQPKTALREALLNHAAAAIDISDGLAKDLAHLARASGTGARVLTQHLPMSDAARQVIAKTDSIIQTIVTGGDDYEVLAAVRPEQCHAFRTLAAALGVVVTKIGDLRPGSGVVFQRADGGELTIEQSGWEHF